MHTSALQRSLPEWLLLAAFMGLSVYVWLGSGEFSSQGQAWPKMLAAALFITTSFQAGLEIYSRLSQRRKKSLEAVQNEDIIDSADDIDADTSDAPMLKWTLYFLVFVAFAVVAYLVGFLTIIPLFVATFMLMHGYRKRPVVAVVTALTVTLIVYIIFGYFANLPLTRGLLLEYHLDWLF